MAHPDDVDFGAAGTVAVWTHAGLEVAYCIVTDGEAGGSDRSVSRSDMAAIRRREQTEAAAVVGVTDLTFLTIADKHHIRPIFVFFDSCWDPNPKLYASHPDHLAAGEAAICAVYPDARNPFAFPELVDEGLEPHTVPELWIMATDRADRVVDATEFFPLKLAALRSHRSQVADGDHLEALLRQWMSGTALAAGLPDGSLAEAFHVVESG